MKKLLLALTFAASGLTVTAQTAAPVTALKQQVTTQAKQQVAAQVKQQAAAQAKQQVTAKAQKMVQKASLPAAQRAIPYSKELQKKLSLNDDQYTKILAVNTECINKKDALKQADQKKDGGSKEIAQYRMEQYKTILTPGQLTKLKTINTQMAKPKS